ncbi:hypothetical protein PAHAL_5G477000 [Panicum hallii]|uniref:Uncharacterized protein n=1 Tax=Panicum hallii TaxID=206008 RepID=A0A2T8INS2_9POAL|nr:hypothetical protein PAHAL_5G477000 [Panicum hallii]
MLTTKGCSYDLTRSTSDELTTSNGGGEVLPYYLTRLNKRQKACRGEGEAIESLPSGTSFDGGLGSSGSGQDASECLSEAVSKMSRSAVLLSLFDGGINVFTCSGVPVERRSSHIKVLTSAKLATTLNDKRKAGCSMMIHVCDVSNKIARGWLHHYDLDLGIAFVKVMEFLDVSALIDSGALTPLVLSRDSSASEDGKELCKSLKAGDGAPLFDGDGNFAGMNLLLDTGSWSCVQMSVIIEQLEQLEKRIKLRVSRTVDRSRHKAPCTRDGWRRNGKHYSTNPKGEHTALQPVSKTIKLHC